MGAGGHGAARQCLVSPYCPMHGMPPHVRAPVQETSHTLASPFLVPFQNFFFFERNRTGTKFFKTPSRVILFREAMVNTVPKRNRPYHWPWSHHRTIGGNEAVACQTRGVATHGRCGGPVPAMPGTRDVRHGPRVGRQRASGPAIGHEKTPGVNRGPIWFRSSAYALANRAATSMVLASALASTALRADSTTSGIFARKAMAAAWNLTPSDKSNSA